MFDNNNSNNSQDNDNQFEKKLIQELATSSLKEQRARRRWGIFFKFVFLAYLIVVTALSFSTQSKKLSASAKEYAAVIKIEGAITADSPNAADQINPLLRAAYKDENAKGIILQINSPGGSAVESNRIYKEIRRLQTQYPDKKIYTVAGDFCASGGYFIAAATDEIYVDESSLIGSIGVIFASFGLVDTLEKLGVERRVIAAGDSKNMLDPFSPQTFAEQQSVQNLVDDIHRVFIDAVKQGREDKLDIDHPTVFEGAIFSGIDSVEIGLADGYEDVGGVARNLIGVEDIIFYQQKDWLDRFSERFPVLKLLQGDHLTPRLQ